MSEKKLKNPSALPKKTRGRPPIGETRRLALTLKDDTWLLVDCLDIESDKLGERVRFIIEEYMKMQAGQMSLPTDFIPSHLNKS